MKSSVLSYKRGPISAVFSGTALILGTDLEMKIIETEIENCENLCNSRFRKVSNKWKISS